MTLEWTLKEWSQKIEENFEKNFYVLKTNGNDKNLDLINKEHIYKDTLNSAQPWTDYQLRCNFPIGMYLRKFWCKKKSKFLKCKTKRFCCTEADSNIMSNFINLDL